MEEWSDFFVAIVGAAAALTGLIFVGVSISLAKILTVPRLTGRASQSLILLLVVLIISSLGLVPQPICLMGMEVLVIGTAIWIIFLVLDIGMLRKSEAAFKKYAWLNIVFTQLSVWPYIISGIILLSEGDAGIYWLIPGIIFSFIKSVLDAWVLLVEIHR